MEPVARPEAASPPGHTFFRDPVTVAALMFLAGPFYLYWWFWQLFRFAKHEGFPNSRSFGWLFIPFMNYVVLYETLRDLQVRVDQYSRGYFKARVPVLMLVVGNIVALLTFRLPQPAALVFLFFGLGFPSLMAYRVQSAINFYLKHRYSSQTPQTTGIGEVAAVVLGITLLGLNVLGATRILTIQSQTNRLQQSAAEQSFLPTASATPTPTAGPFPASGDGFSITSDPNSWVGQGTAFTYSREDAHFYWRPGGVAQPGVAIEVDYSDQIWTVVLVPPAGQTLQVRTYANAVEVPPTGTAPGLSVSGIGHACHSFGTFSVTAIAWDPDGQLNRLDATFLQHCGDPQGPIVSGRIRYIRP